MTIYLYTGTPGSGKSLHAARTIRNQLKRGGDVIANFEVVCDDSWKGNFTYLPNNSVSAGNLVALARDYWAGRQFKEDGLLVVIDEAQLLYNSRNWQESGRMEMLEFMSQHRKYGIKLIMVTQADIMIDRQFRTLVEYECNHRKVSNIGLGGKLISLFAFGEIFYCCVTYYMQKMKVDGYFFRYRKSLGNM